MYSYFVMIGEFNENNGQKQASFFTKQNRVKEKPLYMHRWPFLLFCLDFLDGPLFGHFLSLVHLYGAQSKQHALIVIANLITGFSSSAQAIVDDLHSECILFRRVVKREGDGRTSILFFSRWQRKTRSFFSAVPIQDLSVISCRRERVMFTDFFRCVKCVLT